MFALYRDRLTLALIMAWCMGCQGLCEPTGTYEYFDESLPDLGKSPEMSKPLPDMGQEEMPPPPGCGDGKRQGQEDCDEGMSNSNEPNALCRRDCTLPRCGDGITDSQLNEQCDDKNKNDEDSCLSSCKFNVCGDGTINKAIDESTGRPFELCDDQDQDNLNYCTTLCTPCGNGVVDVEAGEECDGGEFPPQNNDGCSATCQREQLAICESDDPNTCQLSLVSPDPDVKLSQPIALEHKDLGDFTIVTSTDIGTRLYVFRGTPDKSAFVEQRIDRGNDGWMSFGKAIALTKDQLLVSAVEQRRGLVVEYRRNPQGRWSQHKIHRAPIPLNDNDFGHALAIDDQHLAISAPGDDAGKGAVYVYKMVAGEWELDEKVMTPMPSLVNFGAEVQLKYPWMWVDAESSSGFNFLFQRVNAWNLAKSFDVTDDCASTSSAYLGRLERDYLIVGLSGCRGYDGRAVSALDFWPLNGTLQRANRWAWKTDFPDSNRFSTYGKKLVLLSEKSNRCIDSVWDVSGLGSVKTRVEDPKLVNADDYSCNHVLFDNGRFVSWSNAQARVGRWE